MVGFAMDIVSDCAADGDVFGARRDHGKPAAGGEYFDDTFERYTGFTFQDSLFRIEGQEMIKLFQLEHGMTGIGGLVCIASAEAPGDDLFSSGYGQYIVTGTRIGYMTDGVGDVAPSGKGFRLEMHGANLIQSSRFKVQN